MNQFVPYELLDHTADAKFRAYGKTLDEAFSNAVTGMIAIIAPPEEIGSDVEKEITITAKNKQSLLFDLLDEVLFKYDVEKFLPHKADLTIVKRGDGYELSGKLFGEMPTKISGNLKAVTYSEMILEERNGIWIIQVVIDI